MAFSLIDETKGAVPITALSKNQFPAWLAKSAEHERNWLTSIGLPADPGKHAVVPGEAGKLARVLVGLGDGAEGGGTMWALAGLREALPEGTYGLETVPDGADPTRLTLGWALATYAFTRYHAKSRPAAALVWPEGADRGRVERLARPAFLAPDPANTPAGDLGPEELAAEPLRVAKPPGPHHRVIVGYEPLPENYPTIHADGRASDRAP